MINHISIGVKDIAAARRFYDAALKPLGYRCLSDSAGALGYGDRAAVFWMYAAKRPVPPDDQSGLRADYGDGYYTAFIVDPDGYRIEAYHQG
jgi:catechol 2,3-dioxygenase-like lactoylglutathione lyase family enzyme